MFAGELMGILFLMVGFVGLSSYTDDLAPFRLPFFYMQLQPMRERWGKNLGTILHVVEYVIIPLGFAFLFLTGQVF